MDKQRKYFFLNSKGQSTVEYVLLLLVVSFIAFTIFKNDRFKNFFGENSQFFKKLALQMQYSYRHGRMGTIQEMESDTYDYSQRHDSYKFIESPRSRFFIQLRKYPSE